jgi:hypothetical protein
MDSVVYVPFLLETPYLSSSLIMNAKRILEAPTGGQMRSIGSGRGEKDQFFAKSILGRSSLLPGCRDQCPETMHGGALVVAKAVKGVKQGIF